ncbi:REP-associated tyrosine transposase [Jannaschia seohaensis]|uniref:Putative transposase n=1 Tax=Jannaschia seohaensis TaxID=475081 RepID=A0A2Y9AWF2_9RHOB|nr:transposase [Jannaschia seohaensis]PWJ17525.1 putative transposase [Jannaschia seohaensis]SSA47658.1 putative transposase [Jannaschia seohaensis]
MSTYRRLRIPGGSYFFTVGLARRGDDLLTQRIDALRAAYAATVRTMPVRCDAMVVLPDHLHAVWTLPPGDADFSERWRKLKHRFSRSVETQPGRSASKWRARERGIWQRRFWEHAIRDDREWHAALRYVWANPVKHGLVDRAADWEFSSIHGAIRAGQIGADWDGT